MSILCGVPLLECVYCIGCVRWAWKRCLHNAAHDSQEWGLATPQEFEPVPRLCRYIMVVYEDDLSRPLWEPPGGYGIDPDCVILKRTYKDICVAYDYAVLLDNKLGKKKFDGGYVHNGLLKAAGCILDAECDILKETLEKYPNYRLTFAGHSLGSGVAALLTIVVVQNRDRLGNIERKRVRQVAKEDDFLPRTATPLEDVFKSLFWCMRDTCISEERMLKDPRRLYAPGRLYHIVERKPFRCGVLPPVVRTSVPVDGRFEHIVLSCNATSDHAIICIEREAATALELMQEKEESLVIPPKQKMERQQTLDKEHNEEHKAALQRAVTLAVPHAFLPSEYGTFEDDDSNHSAESSSWAKESWAELIQRLFEKDESGRIQLNKPLPVD
ncbi:hypothetical protein SASPL_110745 [Salvia splendens]|uniref:Sn1-specific diacylglycerol lipase alpha n=1 Tax=Salvia splendens TaxID=180675 RepID=A0A8X8Y6Q0_SALSN|nr:hypothetical protein SASPL_110745 [Salvia splendens]